MKTLKHFVFAITLLVGTTLFANNDPVVNDKTSDIQQEITQLLLTPNFSVQENTSALVHLIVNDEGELVVLSVKTDNEQLKFYVKSRLNYRKISSIKYWNKEYKLPVTITT